MIAKAVIYNKMSGVTKGQHRIIFYKYKIKNDRLPAVLFYFAHYLALILNKVSGVTQGQHMPTFADTNSKMAILLVLLNISESLHAR